MRAQPRRLQLLSTNAHIASRSPPSRSSFLRLQPQTRYQLKGLRLSGHEKSAIVKADRDPTIFAALDYFAGLTLQRYLGSPCESFSDQPDSIANLESALGHGNLLSFRLESELDQAADGFRAARQILLLAAPVVEQLRHFRLNANHQAALGPPGRSPKLHLRPAAGG